MKIGLLFSVSVGSWFGSASSSVDGDEEEDSSALETAVNDREEDGKRAYVVEGFPWCGILSGLTVPDWAHDDDPKDIHGDGHHVQ